MLRLRIVLLMPLVVIVLRDSKGRSPEKTYLIRILSKLDFGIFSYVHFWSITGVFFLQNANHLNFKLFCYVVYI